MSAGASPPPRVRIDEVAPADVRPLRQRVLRPHQRVEDLVFPGDRGAGALHLAAREPGRPEIVGVASWLPERPSVPAVAGRPFRLRGMATVEAHRGVGIGAALLAEGAARLVRQGVDLVWCHARVSARGFYERNGFVARGDEFDLPEIGPHVAMIWTPLGKMGPKRP